MAEWITFDGSYVLGAMPTDVRTAYDAWLVAHADKAGRLAEIAGQVRADFRSALSANPNVAMAADEAQLQTRCVPHALTVTLYYLTLEMGLAINTSAQTAFNNAQLYLRELYRSNEVLEGTAVSRSPSYATRCERGGWVLS